MTEFVPHSAKQDRAIFSDKPIVLAATGIQWGKTSVGAIKMKMAMHSYTDPTDAFLITAPTYKVMQQSTLPAFLSLMKGAGSYSKADAVFQTHWGSKCYMRTATDPDSIVGITNIRMIWGDEAGLYSLYFWENMRARAAFKDAQVILTTSPYTLNWIYKEIIRPKLKDEGARPDCEMIRARSDENPYFPKSVYEQNKETMDPRRFRMLFGGEWDKMAGLVYDVFDEVENSCEPLELPTGTSFFGGIDWGFTEPFALGIRAVTPTGMHYRVSESYKSGLTLSDIIQIARQKRDIFGVKMFYCDPSNPGYIEELNRYGIPAMAANNDVKLGVSRHYELIKTRRYKIFKGTSPHAIDEYETYHYPDPEDLKPDQNAKDQKPVGQNDHAMDQERYITIMTYKGEVTLKKPSVPGETPEKEDQFQRLERLKRKRPGLGHNTERWS